MEFQEWSGTSPWMEEVGRGVSCPHCAAGPISLERMALEILSNRNTTRMGPGIPLVPEAIDIDAEDALSRFPAERMELVV